MALPGAHVCFSSRRRHTRFSRDWSSDVCSSHLSLTHARSAELSAGELAINPELTNNIMTNGLIWSSKPTSWGGHVDLFYTVTRFFGDELYSDRSHEIGGAIALQDRADSFFNFKLGASYMLTDRSDLNGFRI